MMSQVDDNYLITWLLHNVEYCNKKLYFDPWSKYLRLSFIVK